MPVEFHRAEGDECPTCGAPVRVVAGDEGTSHYEPTGTLYVVPHRGGAQTFDTEGEARSMALAIGEAEDQRLIETLARVIENRHGTLHGIGNTLREALAEYKRG